MGSFGSSGGKQMRKIPNFILSFLGLIAGLCHYLVCRIPKMATTFVAGLRYAFDRTGSIDCPERQDIELETRVE